MEIVKRFLPFTLLFILQHRGLLCQHKAEKTRTENDDVYQINRTYNLDISKELRPFSNIEDDEIRDIFNPDYYNPRIRYFRTKRGNPTDSLATIRKKLNDGKRKEEMMAADADARMEPNDTDSAKNAEGHSDYGHKQRKTNVEQLYNRNNDKIRILHQQHAVEKLHEFEAGVDCDFENDCVWTWRKDIANGFFITSGTKYGLNETGPRTDADNSEGGKSPRDLRGQQNNWRTLPHDNTDLVKEHIQSFPLKTSYYSSNEIESLDAKLDIKKMFNLFQEKYNDLNVKYCFYYKLFKEHFNYRFGRLRIDTCCECELLSITIKKSSVK
ncbi:unnamed protein product [Diabrotica balteata]|uniref:Uncharacterized protein n=1 Tax=Diabrotica balteata TaxID=107213 RepID=A0A9N9T2U3_DIABA|nr:unnamed protein product [Diabrotica balteata]